MPSTSHGVLTANQVSTLTIDPGIGGLVIVNRSLEGAIWARIDGQNPVAGAPDSYVILGAREFPLSRRVLQAGAVTVKLISDSARAYTVEAIG